MVAKLKMLKLLVLFCLLAATLNARPIDVGLDFPASDVGLPGFGPIRGQEWFPNIWRTNREIFQANVEKDRGSIVFLGDSVIQSWDAQLPLDFPGRKVCNRGICADTSRGVLWRLPKDVLALDPQAVVLHIGINDFDVGARPNQTVRNVEMILDELREYKSALPIFLCAVLPGSVEAKRPSALIRQTNAGLQRLAVGQVTYVDTYKLFADSDGDALVALLPDHIHPNPKGYALWAGLLRAAMVKRGI